MEEIEKYDKYAYLDDDKRWQEYLHRKKIINEWRKEAKVIRDAEPGKKMLLREAKRVALTKIEEAARTVEDFENINLLWNNRDIVESDRVGKHESLIFDDMEDYQMPETDRVIPKPFNHPWWRKLQNGDFNDYIFDCPHEVNELTSSRPASIITKQLEENQKEVLYYWAIRQWTPQQIAAYRGQTDRNIRKVYKNMIKIMRCELYQHLYRRYWEYEPLTNAQVRFCDNYLEEHNEPKRKRPEEENGTNI